MDNVFLTDGFKRVLQEIVAKSLNQNEAQQKIIGYLSTIADGKELSVKLEAIDIILNYEFSTEDAPNDGVWKTISDNTYGANDYIWNFGSGVYNFLGEFSNYAHSQRDKSYYTPYTNWTEVWNNASFIKGPEQQINKTNISVSDIIKAIGKDVPTTNYKISQESFEKAIENFAKLGPSFVLGQEWLKTLIYPAILSVKDINNIDQTKLDFMVKLINSYAKLPDAQASIINTLKHVVTQTPAIHLIPFFESLYKISGGNPAVFKVNILADALSERAFWCLDHMFLNLKDSKFTIGQGKLIEYLVDSFADNFKPDELQKLIIAGSTHIVEQKSKDILDQPKLGAMFSNAYNIIYEWFNPKPPLPELGAVMDVIKQVINKYKDVAYKDTAADYNSDNFVKLVDIISKTKDIEVIKYLNEKILTGFNKSFITEQMKVDTVLTSIKLDNSACLKFVLSDQSILKIDDKNTLETLVKSVLSKGYDINIIFSALTMDETLFNGLKGPIMEHIYSIIPDNLNNSFNKYNILKNEQFVKFANASFSSTEFDDLFNKIIVSSYQNPHKTFFFNLLKNYKGKIFSDNNKLDKILEMALVNNDFDIIKIIHASDPNLIHSDNNKLDKIYEMAAANKNFDIIKILYDSNPNIDKTSIALKYIYQGNFDLKNFENLDELDPNTPYIKKLYTALDTNLFDKCDLKQVIMEALEHNLKVSSDSNKYQAVIQMMHRYHIADHDTQQFAGKISNEKLSEKKLVVENHLSELVEKYLEGAEKSLFDKLTANITDSILKFNINQQLYKIFSNYDIDSGFTANLKELKELLPEKLMLEDINTSYEAFLFFYHTVTQKISDDYFASNSAVAGIHIDKLAHNTLVYKAIEGDFSSGDIYRMFKFGHKSVLEKANILNYSIHTNWHDPNDAYLDGEKVMLDKNHAINHINKNGVGIVIEAVLLKGSPQVCGPHQLDWDLIPNQLHGYEIKAIHKVEDGAIIETINNVNYVAPPEAVESKIEHPHIVGDEFVNSDDYYASHTESDILNLENNYYSFDTDYVI